MLDRLELDGFWWLPSAHDQRVAGKLTFSQEDIKLELFGGFPEVSGEEGAQELTGTGEPAEVTIPFPFIATQPRILGQTQDGRAITLEQCNGRTVSIPSDGFGTTAYGPQLVLQGAWYEPGQEVTFDEIAIQFSDMDTWAYTSGFKHTIRWDEQGQSLASLETIFTPPEAIQVALDDETMLKIEFPWTWSGMRPVTTELHIRQSATFRVMFAKPATIERSLTYVAILRNFLALAVGRPVRVLSVRGFHNPPPEAKPDPFTKEPPRAVDVELLYRLVGLPEPPDRELLPHEMLFTLAETRPRLEVILGTWFESQVHLGPVLARYFHLIHTPPTSREHEFENLVRVLETHHRRTIDGQGSTREHEGRLEEILSSVRQEHREWLEETLEYSHEPKLAQRLKDALARCPKITTRLIGNSRAKSSFIRRVVVTRNFEVHLDPSNQADAARGVALVALTYQLRALVEMTLLLEIGFSCEEIAAIFERQDVRYRQIENLRAQ